MEKGERIFYKDNKNVRWSKKKRKRQKRRVEMERAPCVIRWKKEWRRRVRYER